MISLKLVQTLPIASKKFVHQPFAKNPRATTPSTTDSKQTSIAEEELALDALPAKFVNSPVIAQAEFVTARAKHLHVTTELKTVPKLT